MVSETSSGHHKVKVSGVIVSEEFGQQEDNDENAAVRLTHSDLPRYDSCEETCLNDGDD